MKVSRCVTGGKNSFFVYISNERKTEIKCWRVKGTNRWHWEDQSVFSLFGSFPVKWMLLLLITWGTVLPLLPWAGRQGPRCQKIWRAQMTVSVQPDIYRSVQLLPQPTNFRMVCMEAITVQYLKYGLKMSLKLSRNSPLSEGKYELGGSQRWLLCKCYSVLLLMG